MIQGFNLKGQHIIGMTYVELTMGDSSISSIFHVIDAKTSYKLLLGRPWLYEHGIVAFTLHQCPKYYRGERKINSNAKPFTKVESHFVDARFFEEVDAPKKTMPSTITSTGKGGTKNILRASRKTFLDNSRIRKKANRKIHPLLLSKWIKRSLPL